jgi:hypothetical protein
LYIYKNQLNLQDQRSLQAISTALQGISSISQPINQNLLLELVVDAARAEQEYSYETGAAALDQGVRRKRGRPPKASSTQPSTSSTDPTIPTSRYNLRSQQNN